jgi:hypothetical protein
VRSESYFFFQEGRTLLDRGVVSMLMNFLRLKHNSVDHEELIKKSIKIITLMANILHKYENEYGLKPLGGYAAISELFLQILMKNINGGNHQFVASSIKALVALAKFTSKLEHVCRLVQMLIINCFCTYNIYLSLSLSLSLTQS